MATLPELLDRCISAGPTDGDLGATAILVLRAGDACASQGDASDDEGDEDLFAAWFGVEDEDEDEPVDDDDEEDEGDLPGRWLLAVGECG
jgi:hypothetical protein